MKYTYDYNIEVKNILTKIYEHKIYNIALENNINFIDKENFDNVINIFNSTNVYLGSDLNDFIISLLPTGDAGYFFRVEIAKHFNYSYPKLFDYTGKRIKSSSFNMYALRLWESNMEQMLIEDIQNKFTKEGFYSYIENNLINMANDIVNFVNIENNKKEILIPISNKSELLSRFKYMVLNNQLDKSFGEMLVDIDKLRLDMEKYSATFEMYNEFDKLEDSLEECINKFCKYTSEELYDILINEKGFKYIDSIGLVKDK